MKKNIITFTVILVGLLALMWWGKPAQTLTSVPDSNTGDGNALTATEKLYDFGTISMADGKVSKIFQVTNPTAKDINLESVVTSCMCTEVELKAGDRTAGPFGMQGHGLTRSANLVVKPGGEPVAYMELQRRR